MIMCCERVRDTPTFMELVGRYIDGHVMKVRRIYKSQWNLRNRSSYVEIENKVSTLMLSNRKVKSQFSLEGGCCYRCRQRMTTLEFGFRFYPQGLLPKHFLRLGIATKQRSFEMKGFPSLRYTTLHGKLVSSNHPAILNIYIIHVDYTC